MTVSAISFTHPEGTSDSDVALERNIRELLVLIGEDPERGPLRDTPRRMRKAWREWTRGYRTEPRELLSMFEDSSLADNDEMVVLTDVPVYSHCEHHLAPFFGVAHVGYIPDGRIVGLSKIPRLVGALAARLQVQERLTSQIAHVLSDCLKPRGVAVTLTCRHLCMESRGIRNSGSMTTTSNYLGDLKLNDKLRAEFLARTT